MGLAKVEIVFFKPQPVHLELHRVLFDLDPVAEQLRQLPLYKGKLTTYHEVGAS